MKTSRIKLNREEYKRLCSSVLHRDKYRCRLCKVRNNLHCHHIVFRSQGGGDVTSNVITLCGSCHSGVHLPNPSTGARMVILPMLPGDLANANGEVVFHLANNWKPGSKLEEWREG